jgi:formate/nitrite transporter FocA (FNT family)
VAGAVLFAFGLTTVVYYGLKLYTGTAGFIRLKGDWVMLGLVLLGNIIGCLLTAWLIAYAQPDCIEPASKILAGRLAKGPFACFLLAIGCGFIMTTAVEFARKGKMLPLLLGVPVFILCGFAHSIADAFYFLVSPAEQMLQTEVLVVYVSEVLGNFVGCNLYRWTLFPFETEEK